jgi:hypothetical protein
MGKARGFVMPGSNGQFLSIPCDFAQLFFSAMRKRIEISGQNFIHLVAHKMHYKSL